MRLLQHTWFVAGLLLCCVSWTDARANMDIWAVDSGCKTYKSSWLSRIDETENLQNAFDDALEVAKAAQASLKFVMQKRPGKEDVAGYKRWNRIAETLVATLGFYPKPLQVETSSDKYWSDVVGLFDKMVAALPSSQNDPPHGFQQGLWGLPEPRPILLCGDQSFQWVGLNDKMPGSTVTFKEVPEAQPEFKRGMKGAWVLDYRVFFRRSKGKTGICASNEKAFVDMYNNMVVICDRAFTKTVQNKERLSFVKSKNLIKEGSDINDYTQQLGYIVLHEMMHWFGGMTYKEDGSFNSAGINVDDTPAVNGKGEFAYRTFTDPVYSAKALSPQLLASRGWEEILTYGRKDVYNLAVTHTGNTKDNSGPDRSTKCADSLAHFAAMVYFDRWNWASLGEAHKI